MVKNNKYGTKDNYASRWPTITLRVSKDTREMLEKMAMRRQLPLSRFCADVLVSQHCGNCRTIFRGKRQSVTIVQELQNTLKDVMENNKDLAVNVEEWKQYAKILEEENKNLIANIEKMQRHTNSMKKNSILKADLERCEQYIKQLERESVPKVDFQKLHQQMEKAEKSIEYWKNGNDILKHQNSELSDKIYNLEEIIQDGKKRFVALQCELDANRARFKNAVFLEGEGEEYNLRSLEKLAKKLNMTRDELADAFIWYGLKHKRQILGG